MQHQECGEAAEADHAILARLRRHKPHDHDNEDDGNQSGKAREDHVRLPLGWHGGVCRLAGKAADAPRCVQDVADVPDPVGHLHATALELAERLARGRLLELHLLSEDLPIESDEVVRFRDRLYVRPMVHRACSEGLLELFPEEVPDLFQEAEGQRLRVPVVKEAEVAHTFADEHVKDDAVGLEGAPWGHGMQAPQELHRLLRRIEGHVPPPVLGLGEDKPITSTCDEHRGRHVPHVEMGRPKHFEPARSW
mmetsp:Transcript_138361/g.430188  ORF Transcript_138361/g.430188 Transcript_138361/m.430188 type:complete len:251 (-) Transcript_138361:97-849(-)